MKKQYRIGFCVSGKGRLMQSAILNASLIGVEGAKVILDTNSDPEIVTFCSQQNVKYTKLKSPSEEKFNREINEQCLDADLDLLILTFDRIIPISLINNFNGKIINVHPSLLPSFKGTNALNKAANKGVRFAGATIHEIDEHIDSGAIISQCIIPIQKGENAESMGKRLFPYLRSMYLQTIHWYATDRIFTDDLGRIWVKDAVYGEMPISPALELTIPNCR